MTRSGHGLMRRGYTLVELLIATTLTLVMMGGVATVFGMIGNSVSSARAGLEMADALRAAAQRLRDDLVGIQAPRSDGEGIKPAFFGEKPQQDGYFEYTEGPIGPVVTPDQVARDNDLGTGDTTVGDNDDMLMFTTRSSGEPFVGRHAGSAIQSPDAEVAWFVRGRTLYRRILLIAPSATVAGPAGFYANSDVSVRDEGGILYANSLLDLSKPENRYAHQSLHRFPGSPPSWSLGRPYHPHFCVDWTSGQVYPTPWSSVAAGVTAPAGHERQGLGLPTLGECSSQKTLWTAGGPLRIDAAALPNNAPLPLLTSSQSLDAWFNPHPWTEVSPQEGTLRIYNDPDDNPPVPATRLGEDVILSNVISFDVKAWDRGAPQLLTASGAVLLPGDPGLPGEPGYVAALGAGLTRIGYGAYADLNYMALLGPQGSPDPNDPAAPYPRYVDFKSASEPTPDFFGAGNSRSYVRGTEPYSKNWNNANDWPLVQNRRPSVYDTWSLHYEANRTPNFDDDGNGQDNAPADMQGPPPYPVPLRGIQIKIRVFEPDSRQIREITVVHSFTN